MSGEGTEAINWGLYIKDVSLIVIGTIIGLVASEFNARRQRKKEEKEKAINIISDVVKFVTKANETATDYVVRIEDFQWRLNANPKDEELDREQRAYVNKVGDEMTDFFIELDFYSYQLKTLENEQLFKKFERLMNTYDEYLGIVLKIGQKEFSEDIRKKNQTKFIRQYKDFINYCIETCKANAPKRTLSAPAKKKGPRRKR